MTSSTYDPLTSRLQQVSTNIRYTPHVAAYQYSASGKVLSRTMRTTGAPYAEADHVERYRYDGVGRLVNAANPSANDRFDFDALDNLTSSTDPFLNGCTLTYGDGTHLLTGMSCGGVTHTLTYDALGRVRSYFDGNASAEIEYTSFDKPLQITNASGRIRYTYGADHRAVKKEPVEAYVPEPRFSGHAGAWMTNLFLGDYERRTSPERVEHVYSVRVGGRVVAQRYWRTVAGTSREEWRYLHTDALGSPERTTDFRGDIVELISFDSWGLPRSWAWDGSQYIAVPPDTNIGFTGHRIDYETGLIDAVGRTYNPAYKRFLTADPFVQDPGDGAAFNRFAYVQNDPIDRIDPTGYQWTNAFQIITVSSGGRAVISRDFVGSTAAWFVLSIGDLFSSLGGGSADRSSSEPRGTWLVPSGADNGATDSIRLGGRQAAANRSDTVVSQFPADRVVADAGGRRQAPDNVDLSLEPDVFEYNTPLPVAQKLFGTEFDWGRYERDLVRASVDPAVLEHMRRHNEVARGDALDESMDVMVGLVGPSTRGRLLSRAELSSAVGSGPARGGVLQGMPLAEAKRLVSRWSRGTFRTVGDSIRYHAEKHFRGDISTYLRKADSFNKTRAVKTVLDDGAIRWTRKSGEFLIEREGKIVSYGFK